MVSDLTRRLRVAHIPCPAPAPPSAPFLCSTCCCCWDCQRLLRLLLLLLLLLVLLHARLSSSAQAATVYIALFCLNGICTWKKIRAENTKKKKCCLQKNKMQKRNGKEEIAKWARKTKRISLCCAHGEGEDRGVSPFRATPGHAQFELWKSGAVVRESGRGHAAVVGVDFWMDESFSVNSICQWSVKLAAVVSCTAFFSYHLCRILDEAAAPPGASFPHIPPVM